MTSKSTDADAGTTITGMDGEPVDIDPTDYCCWWVMANGTARSGGSRVVHLPAAIDPEEDGIANDPETDPPAETLCYIDEREDSKWRVKSHAVLPPGFRDVCRRCATEFAEVVDDE